VIPTIYLLDAALEVPLILAWIAALAMRRPRWPETDRPLGEPS
jgi:hypothetical protein